MMQDPNGPAKTVSDYLQFILKNLVHHAVDPLFPSPGGGGGDKMLIQ